MQNKANLQKERMKVSSYLQKDYENKSVFAVHENKAKQTQFQNPTIPPNEREKENGVRGLLKDS